ncbi:MAG: four helix bundle protein [Chitinophagaceae bacterium]|nr:four helix bundle protein [Chitinophagaceae bacterium]
MKENIVKTKSYDFAKSIVKFYMHLKQENEFELSKQLLRAGTSIGANVEEADAGISKKEFASKMSIASKEARETQYWLRLIKDAEITNYPFEPLLEQANELIRILTSIVKTTQSNFKSL